MKRYIITIVFLLSTVCQPSFGALQSRKTALESALQVTTQLPDCVLPIITHYYVGRIMCHSLGRQHWPVSLAMSPNGKRVISCEDDQADIFDTLTGALQCQLRKDTVKARYVPSFSPDAELVTSADDADQLAIWNAVTGVCLRTLKKHTQEITGTCFNHDGSLLATGSRDGNAIIWDVKTGEVIRTHNNIIGITSLQFNPVGTKLVMGNEQG